jgi:hypothetical protein
MDITDPFVVKFCTGQVRPLADQFISLYNNVKRVKDIWAALNIGSKIPTAPTAPDTEDRIRDGADTDGRPVINAALVSAFIAAFDQYTGALEAGDSYLLHQILKIAPNP